LNTLGNHYNMAGQWVSTVLFYHWWHPDYLD
jgi:hypothetical protein